MFKKKVVAFVILQSCKIIMNVMNHIIIWLRSRKQKKFGKNDDQFFSNKFFSRRFVEVYCFCMQFIVRRFYVFHYSGLASSIAF